MFVARSPLLKTPLLKTPPLKTPPKATADANDEAGADADEDPAEGVDTARTDPYEAEHAQQTALASAATRRWGWMDHRSRDAAPDCGTRKRKSG